MHSQATNGDTNTHICVHINLIQVYIGKYTHAHADAVGQPWSAIGRQQVAYNLQCIRMHMGNHSKEHTVPDIDSIWHDAYTRPHIDPVQSSSNFHVAVLCKPQQQGSTHDTADQPAQSKSLYTISIHRQQQHCQSKSNLP